jgi:hypothetical protein
MARIKLKGGQSTLDRRLDRLIPTDFEHVAKFPLTLATLPAGPTPVVLGINWYSRFDTPVLDSSGRYWIKRAANGSLGTLRGGHAICVKCAVKTDPLGWWDFYDQGSEGACVGFSESRMMSLLNRTKYDAPWLYHTAQKNDEWPGENYDGTSVRAGLEVLRTWGHCRVAYGKTYPPDANAGISVYRWATSVQDVHDSIQMPLARSLGAVPLLNSWGRAYPHITWLPDDILAQLLNEDGEAGLVTDK